MSARLPVLNRPTTFAQCEALGLGVHPKSAPTAASTDEDDEQLEDNPHEQHDQPCPFVGCANHLAWVGLGLEDPRELTPEQLEQAVAKLEELDVETMSATCALRGPFTLEEIGEMFGVTRERIRQIEYKALVRLRHPGRRPLLHALRDHGHEFNRPDLHENTDRIGLTATAVTKAAARIVPAKTLERSPWGGAVTEPDRVCSIPGCGMRSCARRAGVAPELVGLCYAHRRAAKRRARIDAEQRAATAAPAQIAEPPPSEPAPSVEQAQPSPPAPEQPPVESAPKRRPGRPKKAPQKPATAPRKSAVNAFAKSIAAIVARATRRR